MSEIKSGIGLACAAKCNNLRRWILKGKKQCKVCFNWCHVQEWAAELMTTASTSRRNNITDIGLTVRSSSHHTQVTSESGKLRTSHLRNQTSSN